MISSSEATAAARRITKERDSYLQRAYALTELAPDARLLAGFVLAGTDTERLVERVAAALHARAVIERELPSPPWDEIPSDAPWKDSWRDEARAALAGGGRVTGPHLTESEE